MAECRQLPQENRGLQAWFAGNLHERLGGYSLGSGGLVGW
jgi:hypothetical protein